MLCTTYPVYCVLQAENAGFASVEIAPDSGGSVNTFASGPKPSTLSLLGLGALFTVVKTARRRRHSTVTH